MSSNFRILSPSSSVELESPPTEFNNNNDNSYSDKKSQKEINQFLKLHVNTFYYIGFYPFNFKLKNDQLVLITHKFQKHVCQFLHGIFLIFSLFYLRKFYSILALNDHPLQIFNLAEGYSEVIRAYTLVYTVWFKQAHFQKLASFKFDISFQQNKLLYIFIVLLHIFVPIRAIYSVIFYDVLNGKVHDFNSTKTILDLSYTAKYLFFIESKDLSNYDYEDGDHHVGYYDNTELTTSTILLALGYFILVCLKEVLTQSCEVLLFLVSIMAFKSCRELKRRCSLGKKPSESEKIFHMYKWTKSLMESANSVISLMIIASYFSLIPMSTIGGGILHFILVARSGSGITIYEVLLMGSYSLLTISFYILAAEAHSKATHIIKWMSYENSKKLGVQLNQVMTSEVANPIGLKTASFTITHAFLGATLSIVVTYCIVLWQTYYTDGWLQHT